MLIEGLVGVVALIAASSLAPGDYFAINIDLAKQAQWMPILDKMGFHMENLRMYEAAVREQLQGRSGGAVSLAVGMAQIFAGIPFFKSLVSFWYHFAIMFEALFILTTIDAGTRVARFLVQEVGGRFHPRLGRTDWLPGAAISTGLVVFAWSYFIWTGSIDTIWPMFGISNQLLAVIALAGRGDRPRERRKGPLSMDDPRPDVLGVDDDPDGRVPARVLEVPPDGACRSGRGDPLQGRARCGAHDHHGGLRRRHSDRHAPALACRLSWDGGPRRRSRAGAGSKERAPGSLLLGIARMKGSW